MDVIRLQKIVSGWSDEPAAPTKSPAPNPPTETPAPTQAPDTLYGDISGNGKVDIMDVIRLQKIVSGWVDGEVDVALCDLTGNGRVDIMDVIRLQKIVSGWDLAK